MNTKFCDAHLSGPVDLRNIAYRVAFVQRGVEELAAQQNRLCALAIAVTDHIREGEEEHRAAGTLELAEILEALLEDFGALNSTRTVLEELASILPSLVVASEHVDTELHHETVK